MKVLVTGADGFVGGWMIRELLQAGHTVHAAARPGAGHGPVLTGAEVGAVEWGELELTDPDSAGRLFPGPVDAVVHLAAVASVREAGADPVAAWAVNTLGTVRVLVAVEAVRRDGVADPRVLLVSTGEVYGVGEGAAHRETDPVLPRSVYAATKLAAEVAALEMARRTGMTVIVARPFPHTGPGQSDRFVAPAFAGRIRRAMAQGATEIAVGNLDPVRDLLDVRDVVAAYRALLERGQAGEVYNVASGEGLALHELLRRLAALAGATIAPRPDPALVRPADIQHLVGRADKLRETTGWVPRIPLDQTLRSLLDAQTH